MPLLVGSTRRVLPHLCCLQSCSSALGTALEVIAQLKRQLRTEDVAHYQEAHLQSVHNGHSEDVLASLQIFFN